MEEENMSSKSNNINQNLFLMSHKSVAYKFNKNNT